MKVWGHIETRASRKLWLVCESCGPFPWFRVARLAGTTDPTLAREELRRFMQEQASTRMACNSQYGGPAAC